MNEADVWAALERGGSLQHGHFAEGDRHSDLRLTKYNGLLDPRGAEALGSALAEKAADRGATLVVVWQDVEDIVLGYVVGQRLGVPVLRTFNADGLVGYNGPLQQGRRALLVTDGLRDPLVPRAVGALLERSGGSLLGLLALVETTASDEPPLASLVSLRPHLVAPAECQACQRGEPLLRSQEPGVGSRGTRGSD